MGTMTSTDLAGVLDLATVEEIETAPRCDVRGCVAAAVAVVQHEGCRPALACRAHARSSEVHALDALLGLHPLSCTICASDVDPSTVAVTDL